MFKRTAQAQADIKKARAELNDEYQSHEVTIQEWAEGMTALDRREFWVGLTSVVCFFGLCLVASALVIVGAWCFVTFAALVGGTL